LKKKLIIGWIIIVVLIIVLGIFIYLNQDLNKIKEEVSKYFVDKTGVAALDDMVSEQASKDLEYLKLIEDKVYTFDDPYVVVNPYDISPLTALIIFRTKEKVEIDVIINDVFVTTMESDKLHSIPIYGLKAGIVNKVVLKYDNHVKEVSIDRTNIKKRDLSVEVKNSNIDIDKELYFLSSPNDMNVFAYDGSGNMVWQLSGNYALDIEFLENGRMYLSNGESSSISECYDGFYEMDYLGKIHKNYSLENGYHHELVRLSDGSVLVAGGNKQESAPYSASFVYQIQSDGKVIHSIDIYDLFREIDIEFADSLKGKNVLINSIDYHEDSKEMILSLRGLNTVLSLNFETKKLNWILGDPEFYSSSFKPYLLNITDGSRFPLGAHTAFLTKDGYLGVFNNGYDMVNESSIYLVDHLEDYSSAVLYKIDGKNISTYWEYDGDKKYFNYALGSFQYYEDHSKLINFGWTFKEEAYVPSTYIISYNGVTYARIMELNSQDEIIFHATYPRGIYRAFKHSMYERKTSNYIDFDFTLFNNNESKLKEISTRDIYDLLDHAILSPYDVNVTVNTVKLDVFFDSMETVDLYFVSEDRKSYVLPYKEEGKNALATVNINLKGNYAFYLKINDVMYDTKKVLSF